MEISSFAVIENEQRYLLMLEEDNAWHGRWFLPGGHLKKNETPEAALVRETREETQLSILPRGMFTFIFYHSWLSKSQLHIYYRAELDADMPAKGQRQAVGTRKTEWFTYREITQLPIRQNLLDVLTQHRQATCQLPNGSFRQVQL